MSTTVVYMQTLVEYNLEYPDVNYSDTIDKQSFENKRCTI